MGDKRAKIAELIGHETSKDLIKKSIREIKPTKKNIGGFISTIIISIILALLIGFSEDTVSMFRDVANIIFSTTLAIFGIIFTVFTIFQALLNDNFIEVLLFPYPQDANKNSNNSETYLSVNYMYIEHMLVCYLIATLIDLVVYIGMVITPEHFILTSYYTLNNALASFLITTYLFINIWIFLELFSVIFNISKLFRIYLMNKAKNESEDK